MNLLSVMPFTSCINSVSGTRNIFSSSIFLAGLPCVISGGLNCLNGQMTIKHSIIF